MMMQRRPEGVGEAKCMSEVQSGVNKDAFSGGEKCNDIGINQKGSQSWSLGSS